MFSLSVFRIEFEVFIQARNGNDADISLVGVNVLPEQLLRVLFIRCVLVFVESLLNDSTKTLHVNKMINMRRCNMNHSQKVLRYDSLYS